MKLVAAALTLGLAIMTLVTPKALSAELSAPIPSLNMSLDLQQLFQAEMRELLLGTQLRTKVGKLVLAALAVLAGAVFTLVDRALRTTPDVFAHPAVNFVLGRGAFRHR